MIEKSGSTRLALATIAILGQAPSPATGAQAQYPVCMHTGAGNRFRVLVVRFERQTYGIALPAGSEHTEPIIRSLRKHLRDPLAEDTLYRSQGKRE